MAFHWCEDPRRLVAKEDMLQPYYSRTTSTSRSASSSTSASRSTSTSGFFASASCLHWPRRGSDVFNWYRTPNDDSTCIETDEDDDENRLAFEDKRVCNSKAPKAATEPSRAYCVGQYSSAEETVSTTLAANADVGDKILHVHNIQDFAVGNYIELDGIETDGGEVYEDNYIEGFGIEIQRGVVLHWRIKLRFPLRNKYEEGARVVARRDLDGELIDDFEPGHLIEGWYPKFLVDREILKMMQKKQKGYIEKEPKKKGCGNTSRLVYALSNVDVVGPAVPWSFLAIAQWLLLTIFAVAAYRLTPPVEHPNAFSSYPIWLYFFVFVAYLGQFAVQIKVLSYVAVAQLQQLGGEGGFELFEFCWFRWFRPSFKVWLALMFIVGLRENMDLASHSFLYGKFVKSYETNPDIAELWRQTISQSGIVLPLTEDMERLFCFVGLFMMTQSLIMLLHAIPIRTDKNEVTYAFGSMENGYRTVMSYVMLFDISPPKHDRRTNDRGADDSWWGCGNKHWYWHDDILRIMCQYGRLSAVTWSDRRLLVKRLERAMAERDNGKLRFLQIFSTRVYQDCFLLLFMDIFEKAFKLEMQVSIVAFAHALRPPRAEQTYDNARTCLDFLWLGEETLAYWILEYDWQMMLPALLAFVSLLVACAVHVRNIIELWGLYKWHVVIGHDEEEDVQKANCHDAREYEKNLQHSKFVARAWMVFYIFLVLTLACFCLHCMYKVGMMFYCPNSIANIAGNCVEINFNRPWKNFVTNQDL